MYTAEDAKESMQAELDRRIKMVVEAGNNRSAFLRVHSTDAWVDTIKYELERRGFRSIHVPEIVLSGDVYFEW